MRLTIHIFLLLTFAGIFTGCNDEVFVNLPEIGNSPSETDPDDSSSKPVFTDSLYLKTFEYDPASIELSDKIWEQEGKSTFIIYDSPWSVSVLFDNHNNTLVIITNSTYYAIPWAKEQPPIPMLRYDSDTREVSAVPDALTFSFGTTSVPKQYMPGERESFYLPADFGVTAFITTSRIGIKARAHITYSLSGSEDLSETDVNVVIWQPVGIRVEWSDIFPAPPRDESSDV